MKYIITESQLKSVMESQQYLNTLLDKISQSGMNSLSDKEKEALIRISKGEEVYDDSEEDDYTDVFNPDMSFINHMENHKHIEVDNESYEIVPSLQDCIEVIGGDLVLHIEPRFNVNEIHFSIDNVEESKVWKLPVSPEGDEQMKLFVDKFVKKQLPKIIRTLI